MRASGDTPPPRAATQVHPPDASASERPDGDGAVRELDPPSPCALCGEPAAQTLAPPRKALTRGVDPGDSSYSVTVVLPDVRVCAQHAVSVGAGTTRIGWCDDARCRTYGIVGGSSPCGGPYEPLVAPRSR